MFKLLVVAATSVVLLSNYVGFNQSGPGFGGTTASSQYAPSPHYRVMPQFDLARGATAGDEVGSDYNLCSSDDSVSTACLNNTQPGERGVLAESCKTGGPCWDFGDGQFIGGSRSTVGLPSDFDWYMTQPTRCLIGMAMDVEPTTAPTGLAAMISNRTFSGSSRGTIVGLDNRTGTHTTLVGSYQSGSGGTLYPAYTAGCWSSVDITDPTLLDVSFSATGAGGFEFRVNGNLCALGNFAEFSAAGLAELSFPSIQALYAYASEYYFVSCHTETSAGDVATMNERHEADKIAFAELLGVTLP